MPGPHDLTGSALELQNCIPFYFLFVSLFIQRSLLVRGRATVTAVTERVAKMKVYDCFETIVYLRMIATINYKKFLTRHILKVSEHSQQLSPSRQFLAFNKT